MFFVPESPRWLVSKGKNEQAEIAFMKIHKGDEDYDLQQEMKVILNAKEAEARESGGDGSSNWGDIFKGPERRKVSSFASYRPRDDRPRTDVCFFRSSPPSSSERSVSSFASRLEVSSSSSRTEPSSSLVSSARLSLRFRVLVVFPY